MPSLTGFKLRFTPSWIMIVLATLTMALLLRLGFWQLHRAHEKDSMLQEQKQQSEQEAFAWDLKKPLPKQYQKIRVQGHYLPTTMLLDNQHYHHQFGYDVLSPLVLDNGVVLMIDRGWVPGESNRMVFPEIKVPQGLVQLQGSVYYPSGKEWVLGQDIEKKEDNLFIIERVNAKLLRQILQKRVYPFIIRLDKQQANGYVREWAIVSMPPERHLAYAVQWFAMALVILILFIALNVRKHDENKSN